MSGGHQRKLNNRNVEAAKRRCLKCEKPFASEHKFNRICRGCVRLIEQIKTGVRVETEYVNFGVSI